MPGGAAAPQPAAWHLCLLALHRSTAGQACTCRMGACASPPGGGKGLHSGAARSAAPKPMQHACQPARRTHRRLRGPPPEVDAAPASSRAGTALSAGAPSAGVLGSPPAVSSSVQPRPSSARRSNDAVRALRLGAPHLSVRRLHRLGSIHRRPSARAPRTSRLIHLRPWRLRGHGRITCRIIMMRL